MLTMKDVKKAQKLLGKPKGRSGIFNMITGGGMSRRQTREAVKEAAKASAVAAQPHYKRQAECRKFFATPMLILMLVVCCGGCEPEEPHCDHLWREGASQEYASTKPGSVTECMYYYTCIACAEQTGTTEPLDTSRVEDMYAQAAEAPELVIGDVAMESNLVFDDALAVDITIDSAYDDYVITLAEYTTYSDIIFAWDGREIQFKYEDGKIDVVYDVNDLTGSAQVFFEAMEPHLNQWIEDKAKLLIGESNE